MGVRNPPPKIYLLGAGCLPHSDHRQILKATYPVAEQSGAEDEMETITSSTTPWFVLKFSSNPGETQFVREAPEIPLSGRIVSRILKGVQQGLVQAFLRDQGKN